VGVQLPQADSNEKITSQFSGDVDRVEENAEEGLKYIYDGGDESIGAGLIVLF
jgi:hypothetical protein